MRLASREQSRKIEQVSISDFHLSEEILMESAGLSSAREIEQAYFPELGRGKVAVVCGPGNNGADGLVVARHLHSAGYRDLFVLYLAPKAQRSKLFSVQLERALSQGITIIDMEDDFQALQKVKSAGLIVDALFGIGLNKNVEGLFAKIIEAINQCKIPAVSLDTPSGLDCDCGVVLGVAVQASMTMSFGLAKPGFFISQGPAHIGRLRILPIGFPYELLRKVATTRFAFTDKIARRYLPKRNDLSNKSKHGHTLILAGRKSYWGAAVLASTSAYRMGTGYVTLASFEDASKIITECPEVMIEPEWRENILENKKFTAVAIGPGLGVGPKTAAVIEQLKRLQFKNVVVDADAITTCVQEKLFPLPKSWVMTPHSGELSRVLGVSAEEIDRDRLHFAHMGAETAGCHVLLKGFRSVLADGDRALIIMSGNSALAKAGTGDVLTGMIAGLLSQQVPVVQGTATAAYLHGRMADDWVREGQDKRSLLASDLRDLIPSLMSRLSLGALG